MKKKELIILACAQTGVLWAQVTEVWQAEAVAKGWGGRLLPAAAAAAAGDLSPDAPPDVSDAEVCILPTFVPLSP